MTVDVCIIHSVDSEAWSTFIAQRLTDTGSVQSFDDMSLLQPNGKADTIMKQADVMVVMFSPSLLQTLLEYPDLYFDDLNASPTNRMIVYCGLIHQDMVDNEVINRFLQLEDWKHVTVGEVDDQASEMVYSIQECVNTVIKVPPQVPPGRVALPGMAQVGQCKTLPRDFLSTGGAPSQVGGTLPRDITHSPVSEEDSQPALPPRVIVSPTGAALSKEPVKGGSLPRNSLHVEVHPNKIPCAGNEALLVFQNALDFTDRELDLYLEGDESYDRICITAKFINPYTYKFSAPEHPPCSIKVSVMRGSTCIGNTNFEYYSRVRDHEKISQFYLRLLNKVLETGVNADQLTVLDQTLQSHMRNNERQCDVFKVYEMEFESESSDQELPTILHLVAKYGLQETAAWLSGQKGVQMACSITNQSHHYPGDIARHHGHLDLSSFLQDLIDLPEDYMSMVFPAVELREVDYDTARYKKPFPVPLSVLISDEDTYAVMLEGAKVTFDPEQMTADERKSGYLHMGGATGTGTGMRRRDSEPDEGDDQSLSSMRQPKSSPAPFTLAEPETSDIYEDMSGGGEAKPPTIQSKRNMSAPDLVGLPKPKTMPTSQQELIEIMDKVKQGEYTQEEAQYLFFDWQHRHRRASETSSFKDKQVESPPVSPKQIKILRDQYKKCRANIKTEVDAAPKKNKGKWFSKKSKDPPKTRVEGYATLPQIKESTKAFRRRLPSEPSIEEEEDDVQRRERSDDSSDGNRDSGFPQDDPDTSGACEEDTSTPGRKDSLSTSVKPFIRPPMSVHDNIDDIPTDEPPPPPPREKSYPAPPLPPRSK